MTEQPTASPDDEPTLMHVPCEHCTERAAASVPAPEQDEAVRLLRTIDNDWHPVSTRPCPTCGPITKYLGEPFGCDRYRIEHPNERHTWTPAPRLATPPPVPAACQVRPTGQEWRDPCGFPMPCRVHTPPPVPAAPPTHDFPSKTHVLPKPSSPRPKPVPPPWRGGAVPAAPTDDGEAVNGSREWWERFAMEQGARAERAEAALESLTERYTVKGHVKVRHGDIEHPANADCRICDALNYSPFVRAGAVPAAPGLDADLLGYEDLLNVAAALLRRYPPDTIVCSHRDEADIGARSTAAIADLVESCLRLSSPEASSEGGSNG